MKRRLFAQGLLAAPLLNLHAAEGGLRIATFEVDVTPPLESPLCHGNVMPVKQIVTPLLARGLVILGSGQPIVLCALDWVALANASHVLIRETIAKAVGTTSDRVAVHTVHQHDAPGSDLDTERLLTEHGLGGRFSNAQLDQRVFEAMADAARACLTKAESVTQVGFGSGKIEKVASNRRVLAPDGKVAFTRMSASKHPQAATAPEGVIDPLLRMVTFWQGERPLAALSYYATHPMSYYGKGGVNWDFIGGARTLMDKAAPGVCFIHFNGAGGNITAGKYNDGSPENRPVLAERVFAGMKAAWESQKKQIITAADIEWRIEPVALPLRNPEAAGALLKTLADASLPFAKRAFATREAVFIQRAREGVKIPLTCLRLGGARILHMPAELFIEYQIAAQQTRPDDFIAMAAYGDNAPGYIGTRTSYTQGGYEVGPVSRVSPDVEDVLHSAMRALLATPA
ncbi:MAG TPA: hypothetical protein PK490_08795 [Prosthecobacter sp.]|nr:hypothetical protein [Prosthecobacter sp.]HRK14376.1 hypothetical protein [Prosthecobacter sp.]